MRASRCRQKELREGEDRPRCQHGELMYKGGQLNGVHWGCAVRKAELNREHNLNNTERGAEAAFGRAFCEARGHGYKPPEEGPYKAAWKRRKISQCEWRGCKTWGSVERSLHVDHCHVTGRVRGLLCQAHNHVLGIIERVARELAAEGMHPGRRELEEAWNILFGAGVSELLRIVDVSI